jgi:colicin import membrane protein
MINDMADLASGKDKIVARTLAICVHGLLLLLLIFGVSWTSKPQAPLMANLWSSLPPLAEPASEVLIPDPEVPAPAPVPPKPVPPPVKVTAPEVVAPKPVVAPPTQADILLKKKEKDSHVGHKPVVKKEPLIKVEPALPPKKVNEALERTQRQEVEKKQAEQKEAELKQAQADKEAQSKAAAQAAAQAKAAAAAAQAQAADNKLINEYMERIRSKVRQNIPDLAGLQGSPVAEFDVVVIPGGDVLSVRLTRPSGSPSYDAAVERAIMKSQPLPLPPNPELMSRFRDIHLVVRPK